MMNILLDNINPITTAQILIALLLAICFLQSGLDKVLDFSGNLDWLVGHFKNTVFAKLVPVLLIIITSLELLGGSFCILGIINYFISGNNNIILFGYLVVSISLICLFLGQRIAKDYEGAAVLVGYFIITSVGILSFGLT